jgi:hypothetical protein
MGIHRKKIEDKKCTCGADLYDVSMKNPYIDDYVIECDGDINKCVNAHTAIATLNSWARSNARSQGDM